MLYNTTADSKNLQFYRFYLYAALCWNYLNVTETLIVFRLILFYYDFVDFIQLLYITLCFIHQPKNDSFVAFIQLIFLKIKWAFEKRFNYIDLSGRYFLLPNIMYAYLCICAKYIYIENFITVLFTKKKHIMFKR